MSAVAGAASPTSNISGYKLRQTPQFTPQQMQLFQQLMGGLEGGGAGGGLGGGLDYLSQLAGGEEGAFQQAEAPAYSAFNKMAGQIGSRYSQLGARDSSSFQQALSGGASQLSEQLGAQRQGMRTSAIESLLGLSERMLGQRPYETQLQEEGGINWSELLGMLGGTALGSIGGPIAAGVGGGVGKALLPKILQLLGLGGQSQGGQTQGGLV